MTIRYVEITSKRNKTTPTRIPLETNETTTSNRASPSLSLRIVLVEDKEDARAAD